MAEQETPQADKRWNVPRCAKEIRALQDKVAALGNGSTSPSSPSEPSAAPSFTQWLPDAMVALVAAEGRGVTGPGSIADTVDALGNVWIAYLLAHGASNDDITAFKQERESIRERASDWLSLTRGDRFEDIRQRQERDGNTDIAQVAGQEQAQTQTGPLTPQGVAQIAAEAAAKAVQAQFGDGQAQPQQVARPNPLTGPEQAILDQLRPRG